LQKMMSTSRRHNCLVVVNICMKISFVFNEARLAAEKTVTQEPDLTPTLWEVQHDIKHS
jgi:hypothetical protein